MQELSPLPQIDESKEANQGHAQSVAVSGVFSVSRVPQTPPNTPGVTSARFIIIRADPKRKKAVLAGDAPGWHLSPRVRQMIVILSTLFIFGGTLMTLVPLAAGQSKLNLPSGLSTLINSARTDWQGLVSQDTPQVASTVTNPTKPPVITIPHGQLVTLAEQDATNAGISPIYFVRQITLESGFNPNAVSPSGAEGIAQFEPSTAAGLGIDPFDPTQALKAAAQMMARYSSQYGGYDKALAAYNAGPAALQNAENSCGAKWLSCMPAQTQNYVSVIMGT